MARRDRRQVQPPENLAARAVDIATPRDQLYLNSVVSWSKNSGIRPWQWAREIGEVHYALGRNRRIGGYARLNVYKVNPDGTRGAIITGGLPASIARTVRSNYGGVRGFVERFLTLQSVPGDAYLIRLRENDSITGYDWVSSGELNTDGLTGAGETGNRVVDANQAVKRITLGGGRNGVAALMQDIEARDFLGRVWTPAGQFIEEADSPLRALDLECEMLHILTMSIKGRLLSRFAMNGILYFPKEINAVLSAAPTAKPGEFHNDTVLNQIINAMTWAVMNPDDPKSRIPIMLTGAGDLGPQIHQVMVDANIDQQDMVLRGELIDRILMGLDNQPGQVKAGKETNHWQNWYQSDDERRVNVQPHLDTMCWALNCLVLNPQLIEAGWTSSRILGVTFGYDLTEANIKTNLAEDSRQLRDRLLIGDEPTRRYSGATEGDAPTPEEYVRMLGVDVGSPYLATFGMGIAKDIDWDKVVVNKSPGPNADSPGAKPKAGPGVGDPGSPNPADRKTDTPRTKRPA